MFRSLEITFEAAVRDLGDPSWQARARAARALGTADPEDHAEAARALQSALGDVRPEVRYAAARSLGDMGDRGAVQALIARLEDEDLQVREAAALALGQIGDGAAFEPLAAALRAGPPRLRFQAVAALAAVDAARAAPLLRAALQDADAEVRACAVLSLAEGPLDASTAAALVQLLDDAEEGPRAEAALALGRHGDARAVPVLCELLSDPGRARDAALALAHVPDQRSIGPLRAVLGRFLSPALLKVCCAYALARLVPEQGRAYLVRASRSLRGDVRGLATELLASLPD